MVNNPLIGAMPNAISSSGMSGAQPVGNNPQLQSLVGALMKQKQLQKQQQLLAGTPTLVSQYSPQNAASPGDGQGGSGGIINQ